MHKRCKYRYSIVTLEDRLVKIALGLLVICTSILLTQIPDIAVGVPAAPVVAGPEGLLHGGADGDNVGANTLYRPEDLLQFRSSGHVIGFTPQRMYIVGMGYSLIEKFAGTTGVTPVKGTNEQVRYSDLWPGISLSYETREDGIAESIYQLKPGADVSDIHLTYNSVVTVTEEGSLNFAPSTGMGQFSMTPPRAWQELEGKTVPVAVSYVQHDDQSIGFRVGVYDVCHPLIIDPIYQWHTFYGSGSEDYGDAIAVDANGNIYVTGHSDATWNGPGGFVQPLPKHGHSGSADIVVLKLNSNGLYQWHTFYGSADYESGKSITVDKSGNVYVTGRSGATWNGPGGEPPKNEYSGGSTDALVLKLNSSGNYQWHTFYGSDSRDGGLGVAADGSRNVYIAGYSDASWKSPEGQNPKNGYSGGTDIVILKLADPSFPWSMFRPAIDQGGQEP